MTEAEVGKACVINWAQTFKETITLQQLRDL